MTDNNILPPAEEDLSISLASANLRSIVFALPLVVIVLASYIFIWGRPHLHFSIGGIVVTIALFLGGVVAHEAIHGIIWALWGTRSFSTIKFGMNIRALAPYAHATVPMKAGAYRLGAFGPAFILGVIPSCMGLAMGNFFVTLYGIIFLAAAAGDFLILWLIRKVPSESLVKDHPTRAGCTVISGAHHG